MDADNSISISVQWLKNGTQLSTDDNRIKMMEMFSSSSLTYVGSITIAPLSMTLDSVNVICMVTLASSLSHVLSSTTMTNYHPSIIGEVVM